MVRSERLRPRRIPIGSRHPQQMRRRNGDPTPGLCCNSMPKLFSQLGAIRKDGQSTETVVPDEPRGGLLGQPRAYRRRCRSRR
jgi:hypothetical protein